MLYGEVDEVSVYQYQVRRTQLVVVLEKHAGGHLWTGIESRDWNGIESRDWNRYRME